MPQRGHIAVILNPKARGGAGEDLPAIINNLSHDASLLPTKGPGDATRLAYEAAREGARAVVAAGGDGTVNQVVAGLARAAEEIGHASVPALGVLPTGTMNVFARELGIAGRPLEEAWEIVEAGVEREVDVWEVGEGNRFIQIAGVGADAEIISKTTWESKRALGPLSYVVGAAGVVGGSPPPLQVTCPIAGDFEGTSVLVGSGRLYGGPFVLFPDAKNDDGLLDVLVLRRHGPLEILNLLKAIALTGYEGEADLDYFQSPGFEVRSWAEGMEAPLQVDGELGEGGTPLKFRLATAPLRVIAPPRTA